MHLAGAFESKHADVPAGADQPRSGYRTPREEAELAKHAFEVGIHGIEVGCSLEDDVAELERLIRDARGEAMRIILDPSELRSSDAPRTSPSSSKGSVTCFVWWIRYRGATQGLAPGCARTRIQVAVQVAPGYAEQGG